MDDYRDLTIKDFSNGNSFDFVRSKLLQSDAGASEDGYGLFGLHLDSMAATMNVFLFMYKFYFRADAHGAENLPESGRALLVSNHAPILPIDACMLVTAALVEPEKPRFLRVIVNKNISSIPFFSTLINRCGQIIGCDENVQRAFDNDCLILVFPTGAEGRVHTIFQKYQVDEFTYGFMEYALKNNTPIVPTCVTGSEEAALVLAGVDLPVGGFKHFPLSPIFPWLGLLGLLPFPSKFDIYFEKPIDFFTEHSQDVDNPVVMKDLSSRLRETIQQMLDQALGR